MTISFDIEYDAAEELVKHLRHDHDEDWSVDLKESLIAAINDEDERAWQRRQETLMESGGVDDSRYREDMKDAGRGRLLG